MSLLMRKMFIADLDQNGEADLLVTTDEGEEGYFTMSAYKQNRAVSSFDFKCSMQISRNHPTIIDIDGDHKWIKFFKINHYSIY